MIRKTTSRNHALWSLGIVLMQSTGLTTVTACIALLPGQAEPTVRERLGG